MKPALCKTEDFPCVPRSLPCAKPKGPLWLGLFPDVAVLSKEHQTALYNRNTVFPQVMKPQILRKLIPDRPRGNTP